MTDHTITFLSDDSKKTVLVPTGTLLVEAARKSGIEVSQPCGGQGRCGRCAVQVTSGNVRRRSTLRLSEEAIEQGFALACQSTVEGDLNVFIPPQEKIERRLATDRTVTDISVPIGYNIQSAQTLQRIHLTLPPPSTEDQTDDWSRLQTALRVQGFKEVTCSLSLMQKIGGILREGEWQVSALLDKNPENHNTQARLVALTPGHYTDEEPLWGTAIDIGTTTVTLWLVELVSGEVRVQVAEYNSQIARGEDVISRIIFASKNDGKKEMRERVLETINTLLDLACKRVRTTPDQVKKATISGNSTMIHLFLGIPASSIRLSPFITTVNHIPQYSGGEVGLNIDPDGTVDCLPGVASYVGSDITAGVLSSGIDTAEKVTLFLDVGTNGEIVLGNRDWLVACACSAGPAFEGAGVLHGMRATMGAIEEIWVNSRSFEPTYRVIGGGKPRGLCGSGLISLLAELFLTGVLDKAGNYNLDLDTPRIRQGEHGAEYVVAWAKETVDGNDIIFSRVDIDNLLRAKAAIYAGFTVLADQVGVKLQDVNQVLIGGSFGKYINVEKAVQIGLLPDMPWERFNFLGNTSVRGAYYALLDWHSRQRIKEIANRMTYIELSANNTFYDAFMSAMFLPHTDTSRFPSIEAAMAKI
ncbi:MAG: ASKHA domain-containing protein [Anaerolineales bacterium]|nr:ASKHA domain-containing protein [Anaerolineales bacterium]